MGDKTSLGDRMKEYENISRINLSKRMPMIIRLDGKAFHSFTKGFKRPYDEVLINSMWETAKYLCENIQGCKIAYVQSDEISLFINNYESIDTEPWFNNNIQKITSVSASMATLAFNKAFYNIVENLNSKFVDNSSYEICTHYLMTGFIFYVNENNEKIIKESDRKIIENYKSKYMTAMFDSRVFILPEDEVVNYFIWRQKDATRNSIQMLGQANFSHKELQGKSCNEIQDLLKTKAYINWNNISDYNKRGACILEESYFKKDAKRTRWIVDTHIPIFTQNRDYIKQYV